MKKKYMTPEAEKIQFDYHNQVVAASSGSTCENIWVNTGVDSCTDGDAQWEMNN